MTPLLDQVAAAGKMLTWGIGSWVVGTLLAQQVDLPALPPGVEAGGIVAVMGVLIWFLRDLVRQRDVLQQAALAAAVKHQKELAQQEAAAARALAEVRADSNARVELVYQSRLQERDEFSRQLDALRQHQAEHSRELYQDLVRALRGEPPERKERKTS